MADIESIQARTAQYTEQFKARLNSRATKPPETPAASLAILKGVKKPFAWVFVFLGILALCLDLLNIPELATDFTLLLWVLSTVVELYFFLLMRSLMNRGMTASLLITGLFLISAAFSILPGPNILITVPIACVIAIFGILNKNIRIVDASKETVLEDIQGLQSKLSACRKTAATLMRVGRATPALAKATRAIAQSSGVRALTKGSRAVTLAGGLNAIDCIPFVKAIPFTLLGVYLTYRSQQRNYQEAQELLQEYEGLYASLASADEAVVQAQMQQFTAQVASWHQNRMQTPQKNVEIDMIRKQTTVQDIAKPRPQPVATRPYRPPAPMRDIAFQPAT